MLHLLNDGGPLFMYTNLLILITSIVLIVKVFLNSDNNEKVINVVKHLSLFALVWGFLGLFIGLVDAFDKIEDINGDIHPAVLASGLKIGLLAPSFGMVVFLITRLGLLSLTLTKKGK